MNMITKIPGPLLIFLGALSLSFGGLIVKSFEGATLWQILFWRSFFFTLTVLAFLIISYKKDTFKSIIKVIFSKSEFLLKELLCPVLSQDINKIVYAINKIFLIVLN